MKHHETREHSSFDATISALSATTSAIAQSCWRYWRGVSGDIGDCGVGITPQMCNRVTNHGDMSIFSKPASTKVSASSADIVTSNGECSSLLWCFTMFWVFHDGLLMVHDVLQCFTMYHNVLQVFHDLLLCLTMFYYVWWVVQRTASPDRWLHGRRSPQGSAITPQKLVITLQKSAMMPQGSSISPRKWSHAKLCPEWRVE